jgi:response regulator RpfG family c-di-GMP phosphodiesterase
MPQLRIKNGPAKGTVQTLSEGMEGLAIGREAALKLDDAAASRKHAEVFAIGDMYFLRDLGSSNGTFLNDERVAPDDPVVLHPGDLFRIGSTYIVFEEPAPAVTDHPGFSHEEEDLGSATELSLDAPEEGALETAEVSVRFPVLSTLAKACSTASDVPSLMEHVCQLALNATPADAVYIFLRSEGNLVPVAHRRRGRKERELKISTTIIRRALQRNRSILVSDAQSDKRFAGSESVVMEGIRSVLCAPLAAHTRVDGALYLHSATLGNNFTDDHLRLVTAIALQAGVAIEALEAAAESHRQLLKVLRTVVRAHEHASSYAIKGHGDRTRACARSLCRVLDLPAEEARVVELAALLHGIGKLAAPDGAFERAESHDDYAALGADLLQRMGLRDVAPLVQAHLERLDGTGAPRKLIGHQIPEGALIVGLAEEFDRMLSTASADANGAEALEQVLARLAVRATDQFGAELFDALVAVVRAKTGP